MDKNESMGAVHVLAERVGGCACHPVNGCSVSSASDGLIVLEPFFDLPPLPDDRSDAKSPAEVKRQIWGTYAFSPVQARILIDLLGDALKNLVNEHEKDSQ